MMHIENISDVLKNLFTSSRDCNPRYLRSWFPIYISLISGPINSTVPDIQSLIPSSVDTKSLRSKALSLEKKIF